MITKLLSASVFLATSKSAGGYIITYLILGIVALIMMGIGIANLKSTSPVGFYTGIEPPSSEEITDIPAYNKKHGWLWIGYGLGYIACALLPLLTNSELLFTLIMSAYAVGGTLMVMVGHMFLEKRYRKQAG